MSACRMNRTVKTLLAAIALATPVFVMAQDLSLLKNGDFEELQPGSSIMPQTWRPDRAESGYALTTNDAHDGMNALEIGFDEKVGTAGYAGTIQGIALPDLAGRTLIVSGWLRRTNVESIAGLWLAFFDASGERTDYVNDYDTPWADAANWNRRTIRARVPAGTVRMLVGASISGKTGKLLVDGITMESVDS